MCGKAVSPSRSIPVGWRAHGPDGVQAGSLRGVELVAVKWRSLIPPTC